MNEEFLPSNPGPVPVSEPVWMVMADPMVPHRSADFEALSERTRDGFDGVER